MLLKDPAFLSWVHRRVIIKISRAYKGLIKDSRANHVMEQNKKRESYYPMGTKSQVAEMNSNDTLETVFLFLIPRLW